VGEDKSFRELLDEMPSIACFSKTCKNCSQVDVQHVTPALSHSYSVGCLWNTTV